MMQRGQHPLGMLPRQIGYPLSFRGQVCGTQSSLPCFSSMGLTARRLPSLRRVPVSPVPRFRRYCEAATTSRSAYPSAYGFASGFRMSLAVRARLRAPDAAKSVIGPGALFDRRSVSGCFMRTKAGPLRFPGDPSHTFALLRDPGRTGIPGHSGFPDAAPGSNTAKASALT